MRWTCRRAWNYKTWRMGWYCGATGSIRSRKRRAPNLVRSVSGTNITDHWSCDLAKRYGVTLRLATEI